MVRLAGGIVAGRDLRVWASALDGGRLEATGLPAGTPVPPAPTR